MRNGLIPERYHDSGVGGIRPESIPESGTRLLIFAVIGENRLDTMLKARPPAKSYFAGILFFPHCAPCKRPLRSLQSAHRDNTDRPATRDTLVSVHRPSAVARSGWAKTLADARAGSADALGRLLDHFRPY